jgi:hypothetical protein
MQLFEAIGISLLAAMIVAAIDTVRIKYTKRIKVFEPWAYKFNESGAMIEVPVDSLPSGALEAAMERLHTENKLPKPTAFRRTNTILFAATAFIIQLIIFMTFF